VNLSLSLNIYGPVAQLGKAFFASKREKAFRESTLPPGNGFKKERRVCIAEAEGSKSSLLSLKPKKEGLTTPRKKPKTLWFLAPFLVNERNIVSWWFRTFLQKKD
jgi:hypothetical protein